MNLFEFFVGMHRLSKTHLFTSVCLSLNVLWGRKKPVDCPKVIVDSGAFMELKLHGKYRRTEEEHARELARLHRDGVVNIACAVAQDYMCEPFMLEITGLTVAEHQRLTIERYDALMAALEKEFNGPVPFHIMPVLQGFTPGDYVRHVIQYGDRLKPGMWVGVGSVCKRQGDPRAIVAVLMAIKSIRPDLLLHGFGVKKTALKNRMVRALLATADSMAWSFAARKQGRDPNDPQEAINFVNANVCISHG